MNRKARFIIFYVVGSILVSYLSLETIYKDKKELPLEEENLILNKFGAQVSGVRLSSYPEGSNIIWHKKEKYQGDVSLNMSIETNNSQSRYYYDINFLSPLDLSSYNDAGNLEFWVKGGKNYSFIESLDIYFRDNNNVRTSASLSEFIELNNRWQDITLSLSEFTESEAFDWENVSGIVYVVMAKDALVPIGFFIDDLKIVNGNDTVYDVFSHFD